MKIEVNKESASVTLSVDGTFTAGQLQELLHQIAEARAQVADDPSSPVGLPLRVAYNPAYWTEPDRQGAGSMIAFRHPGFGWLGCILPLAEAARLSNYITAQLLTAATASTATAGAGDAGQNNGSGGGFLH